MDRKGTFTLFFKTRYVTESFTILLSLSLRFASQHLPCVQLVPFCPPGNHLDKAPAYGGATAGQIAAAPITTFQSGPRAVIPHPHPPSMNKIQCSYSICKELTALRTVRVRQFARHSRTPLKANSHMPCRAHAVPR
jgi:hypothetical protein